MTSAVKKEPNLPKYSQFKITDPEDLLYAKSLLEIWKIEQGQDPGELDWNSCLENLYACFARGAIFGVRDNTTGNLVGASAMIPSKPWTDKDMVMLGMVFFIHPDHRKSRMGATLLQSTKDYAKSKGMKLVLQVTSTKDVTLKDRFFRLFGLKNIGGIYEWEVQ